MPASTDVIGSAFGADWARTTAPAKQAPTSDAANAWRARFMVILPEEWNR